MEKEFNHHTGQVREEGKGEHTPYSQVSSSPDKRDEPKAQDPVKRKRIRAYQRIDYWQ
jgi:hypothetical protein